MGIQLKVINMLNLFIASYLPNYAFQYFRMLSCSPLSFLRHLKIPQSLFPSLFVCEFLTIFSVSCNTLQELYKNFRNIYKRNHLTCHAIIILYINAGRCRLRHTGRLSRGPLLEAGDHDYSRRHTTEPIDTKR